MLRLLAYFDESGHSRDPDTKFLGIAGCLSEATIWHKVEREWKAVLESESLPYWHMREFAHSQGAFNKWKGNECKRREVYARLWQIILAAKVLPLGCFVPFSEYHQYFQEDYNKPFSEPYYLCYLQCIGFIAQTKDFEIVHEILPVFDNKDGIKGESLKMYDHLSDRFSGKIVPPVFSNTRDALPLQIADIIAYESKKEFERQLDSQDKKPRWGFYRLDELIKESTGRYPLAFGDKTCPIALQSLDELKAVSEAQKKSSE